MKSAWAVVVGAAVLAIGPLNPIDAQQGAVAGACRISGKATSGTTPLPGVSVTVQADGAVKGATSTDTDGTYHVNLPIGSYRLGAELTGFAKVERDLSVTDATCTQTVDLQLALGPRQPVAQTASRGAAAAPAEAGAGSGRSSQPTAAVNGRGGGSGTSGTAAGRGHRFETLAVQTQAGAAAGLEVNPPERETEAAALLLPPGFSTEGPTQAVAINGNMASLDRGMLSDRLEAIGRGEFDPVTGEFAQGFGPGAQGGLGGVFGGPDGGFGGRGGPGGPGGRGGPGGPGPFVLAGRGGRQNTYSFTSNYTFGGSVLDSAPYQLHPDSPVTQRPYTRNTYGGTVGGPVKIRHIYDGTRRTNFMLSYSGNHGANLFDQYATVPTDAMRAGDFSSAGAAIINPATGQPFAGNQIPAAQMSATALALLPYIPSPNLTDTSRNFHYVTTTSSSTDNINLRVTHNFTPNVAGRGGRGGPGGGGRVFAGGPGGRAGRGVQQGTSVSMTAQLQYRRNDNDQTNVFPALGGTTTGSNLADTGHVEHRPQADDAQHLRQLLPDRVLFVQPVCLRRRCHGRRRHRRRFLGSVRLGAAAALVLQPLEPSRRDAVAAHGLTAHDGIRMDAPITEAHAACRRGFPSGQHEQPDRLERERCVRLHGLVLVRWRVRDSRQVGSTSPTSCSGSLNRPRCNTDPAT